MSGMYNFHFMMFYGVYKMMWREMRMKQQNLSQKYREIGLDKFKKMLHVKDTATSLTGWIFIYIYGTNSCTALKV